MKPAIRVENLSKFYRIGPRQTDDYHTLRETITAAVRVPLRRLRSLTQKNNNHTTTNGSAATNGSTSPDTFWALRDVSFEVPPGEVVGIIGRNGAGKSTLLKILSRITEPTTGRVTLRGRVGSLLEVGTGFHTELTGRENIYLNGAILGMRHREVDRKFDEIVAFAEVDQFLDTPVKRYSSGMHMRLAFAVAAHLDPDVLIVDEVLAVGDAAFQKKCLGKMQDITRGGRTVLFVSHNMPVVESLCTQGLFLHHGHVVFFGRQSEAIEKYSASLRRISQLKNGWINLRQSPIAPLSSPCIVGGRVTCNGNPIVAGAAMGEPLEIQIACFAPEEMTLPTLGIGLNAAGGQRVTTLHSTLHRTEISGRVGGPFLFRCALPFQSLLPGDYAVDLRLEAGVQALDVIQDAFTFTILPSDFFGNGRPTALRGLVAFPQEWSFADGSAECEWWRALTSDQ